MERKINQEVAIKEIFFDEELYPRQSIYWKITFKYQQSMLSGAEFPLITLAVLNGKKYLVDGMHRIEAYKLNKKETIKAEIFTGWNKQRIFEEAIKRNIAHGQQLSIYEKRKVALKLRAMKYPDEKVSELVQVPLDKLENFIAERLVSTMTGETIVKGELKHLAGQTVEQDIEGIQKQLKVENQERLLKELVYLLEKKMIDTANEKISKLLNRLKILLV